MAEALESREEMRSTYAVRDLIAGDVRCNVRGVVGLPASYIETCGIDIASFERATRAGRTEAERKQNGAIYPALRAERWLHVRLRWPTGP